MPERSLKAERAGAAKQLRAATASPKPEVVLKTSPEAVLSFLKQAALEAEWTPTYLVSTLGVNHETGKQIAAELSLVGYAEPVPRKRETYRNTPAGNKVAGARHPRLTRKTAEEILADVADRAEKLNLDRDRPVSVEKIVAFGGITTLHARIQDVELGVYLAQKLGRTATDADRRVVLKLLKGRSAALKLYPLEGWLLRRPGRVVWEK